MKTFGPKGNRNPMMIMRVANKFLTWYRAVSASVVSGLLAASTNVLQRLCGITGSFKDLRNFFTQLKKADGIKSEDNN